MKAAQKYPESTVFALPLGDGTYGLGVVVRRAPRGRLLFGYFFGVRLKTVPLFSHLPELHPVDAVLKCMFGDLGLFDGSWIAMDQIRPWNREDWPMPYFYRDEYAYLPPPNPTATRLFLVKRSDDNPANVIWDRRVEQLPPGCLRDSLYGAGAVETSLRMLLDGQKPF